MLVELGVLHTDVFASGVLLLYFIVGLLGMQLDEDGLDEAFGHDVGLEVHVVADDGTVRVVVTHLGEGDDGCGWTVFATGGKHC